MTRRLLCWLSTSAFAATILVSLTVFAAPPPKQDPAILPESGLTGNKALYTEKCSACHDLPDPVEKAYSKAKWRITVARMLNEYKASETISKPEAARIVDYLGTFSRRAAREPQTTTPSAGSSDSAADDIWNTTPVVSHVFTFYGSNSMAGLTPMTAGVAGHPAVWSPIESVAAPQDSLVRVNPVGANPNRFPVLVADDYSGRELDVRVKFHILRGKISPAAGIVVGFQNPANYDVIRFNSAAHNLALIQIRGDVHTTLRTADVTVPTAEDSASTPLGWHTLRVQARQNHLRAWLDLNKIISVDDPDYSAGKVGLWTQGDTAADFGSWSIDLYDLPSPALPVR